MSRSARPSVPLAVPGLLLVYALLFTGCATPPSPRAPGADGPAVIELDNRTTLTWDVTAEPEKGRPIALRVPPRAVRRLDVSPGKVRLRAVCPALGPGGVLETDGVFEAGEPYVWPLATLLESSGEEAR